VEPDRFDIKLAKSTRLEIGEALIDQGYEVSILTGYAERPYKPKNSRLKVVSFHVLDMPFVFRWGLLLKILVWLVVNGRREDIIILSPEGLWLAPALRLRGMKNLHLDVRTLPLGVYTLKAYLDRLLFWRFTMGWLSRFAVGHSFITERLKCAMEQEFKRDFEDYVIWHSGVNTRMFSDACASMENPNGNAFSLFYHGSIYKGRGLRQLVRALSELQEPYASAVQLLIVGEGPGLVALKKEVKELGLEKKVIFKGRVPYEQIAGEVAQADCCICPLPDRPEWNVSSPLKVFEYMACGKPIIVTPIPAHRDVLEGQDFVVWSEGGASTDLKNAIEHAYDSRLRLARAAKHAPRIVRDRFDWSVQARRLANYLATRFASCVDLAERKGAQ
jgi:glycosyltransferase involved in cell wall biosynthesis